MAIKAIIFDLDGVLVDADKIHFDALNKSLTIHDISPISWQEHLTIYKGLPTAKKLEILTERKGLSKELHQVLKDTKQRVTSGLLYQLCKPDLEKIEMMRLLKRKYRLYVCSNAIRNTVDLMLKYSALYFCIEDSLSNEDVTTPKPNSEIYLKAFRKLGLEPTECLIVEDSDVGYKAAMDSGAFVCKVDGPEEVNYYRILKDIQAAETINIVIPAAGQGKRFSEMGYQHPKPLIDVLGKPMIEWVLSNFKDVGKITLLMQRSHISKYCAEAILKQNILPIDGITEGAACTVLLAKKIIDNNNELIIANSDQYLHLETFIVNDFVKHMREKNADGGMLVFESDNPKWSYAKHSEDGSRVIEVAEKKVISNLATVGIYYYKYGKDFVKYAEQMINKNIRTNDEFYVCPVFNEFIQDWKKIYSYTIGTAMCGLGTPEDLNEFIKDQKKINEIIL